jgi:hypothetical protein
MAGEIKHLVSRLLGITARPAAPDRLGEAKDRPLGYGKSVSRTRRAPTLAELGERLGDQAAASPRPAHSILQAMADGPHSMAPIRTAPNHDARPHGHGPDHSVADALGNAASGRPPGQGGATEQNGVSRPGATETGGRPMPRTPAGRPAPTTLDLRTAALGTALSSAAFEQRKGDAAAVPGSGRDKAEPGFACTALADQDVLITGGKINVGE